MDLETNKAELPTGKQSLPTETLESVDFKKIVAESKSELAADTAAQIKRPVGRPPKAQKETQSSASESATQEKLSASVTPEDKKAVEDLSKEMQPLLQEAVKVPFDFLATRFKNPEVMVSDDEAKTPAYYLSKYIRYQLPELETQGPKMFSLYAFIISMVLVTLKKLPKMKRITVVPSSQEPTDTEKAPDIHDEPLPRTPSAISGASIFAR